MTFDTRGDNGFGIVAGQAAELSDQGNDGGLSTILEGVATLLDWRKRTAFQADVTVRLGNDSRNYHVTARPRELSYEVASVETGKVESFDPRSGMIREGASERPLEPYQIDAEPTAVRLAFPGQPRHLGASRRQLPHDRCTSYGRSARRSAGPSSGPFVDG